MDQLIEKVIEMIRNAGLVEVEVSIPHVHLRESDVEVLFGKGAVLHEKSPISQPGQYLCEEYVNLIGPEGRMDSAAVIGPVRENTQIEVTLTDARRLGVKAPIRESGKLEDAAAITMEGPYGSVEVPSGVIVAHSHVHVPEEIAQKLDLKDKERVDVQVLSERPVTFHDVIIRVSSRSRFRMHVDLDEANAAGINGFTLGKIIKK